MTGPANATTTSNGRTYEWPPTGEVFDSVTTIIKGGTPTGYGLQKWLKSVNVRYAVENIDLWMPLAKRDPESAIAHIVGEGDRFRDKAAVRGTEVHDWAEKIVLGTATGKPPVHLRGYVDQFVKFLEDWKPTYELTEATVYNRTYGYAGTLDWIARIDGFGLVLGDIKTKEDGKTIYGEVALQLAAYAFAEFIGLPDGSEAPMPQIDSHLALVIRPSSYDLLPVKVNEDVFRDFLYVQQVRRFAEQTGREVIGRRLRPPSARPIAPVNVSALVD